MNNILTFEDYKKMNIRQVESVIYRQFIEENIKEEVNEGLIRKAINKASSKFIQSALEDEIKKGKELEKRIKEALDGLDKGFDDIKQKINANNKSGDSKSKLNALEKVKEAIKAVQSQAFDTLTMIGSEGEIDFAGFLGSGSVIAAAHFGILFSPVSAIFITRKAYKYFLGIIKQTIRRNLLIIQLNFDQFENLILQKSFEAEDDGEMFTKIDTLNDVINKIQAQLCDKDTSLLGLNKSKKLKAFLDNLNRTQKALIQQNDMMRKNNPFSSLWADQHNNTYTRTLEQIKQYINDDSQKELDSLKNSIQKMAGNDPDLIPFGELMISAAEEYAVHTNHGINNNFIKMSSVFNLENQKNLIKLIKETEDEKSKEIEKKREEINAENKKKESEENIKKGKDIYDRELSGKTYTFDEFEDKFSDDDVTCLKEYFVTEEGDKEYKELIDKNHLYKYLIPRPTDIYFNNLLDSIYSLDVVEISSLDDFFEKFTSKKQALYYIMSERSIKCKLKNKDYDPYFGFNIGDSNVEKNVLTDDFIKDYVNNNSIFSNFIKPKKFKGDDVKKRYFLTFKNILGDNLFDILHKEFKTEMFDSKGKYISNISNKNKEILINIINKHLNLGKNIPTQLAQYLVRLEAHMLLNKPKKDWFVVKDDKVISRCFGDNFSNKNAFVELSESEFKNMKKILEEYATLRNNDFKPVGKKDEDETK